MNYIKEAYESVERFNRTAGNLDAVDKRAVDNQLSLCFEELTEAIDGLEAGDMVALLDGAVDMFVVGAGLLQQLDHAGFEVERALKRVTENNLTKFPASLTEVDYELIKKEGWYKRFNLAEGCFVLKDVNGKIRKPFAYKNVSLEGLEGDLA